MVRTGTVCFAFVVLVVSVFAQTSGQDFLKMPGSLYRHPFADLVDSLSSQEIVELRNEKGLPIWFGRDMNKVVCLTGECRMVHLWLFWDGAGNYLGIQPHENEPLTKTDHNKFSENDYRKLNFILSDTGSVLKTLKQEELIIKAEKKETKQRFDAVTGATQPSLQDYLVKNAAYTCYTLWHTVYGPTRTEVLAILDKRADAAFLQLSFETGDLIRLRWAVRFIRNHPEYHDAFYRQIINQIKSEDFQLSQLSLDYFDKSRLDDPVLQSELISNFAQMPYRCKFDLIWKLSSLKKVKDENVMILLQLFDDQIINASMLSYIYQLIHPESLKNHQIYKKLKKISKNDNRYVRDITLKLLSKRK